MNVQLDVQLDIQTPESSFLPLQAHRRDQRYGQKGSYVRSYDADKCVRCTNYAEEALKSQEENRVRGCDFIGPNWNPDRRAHFDWCMADSTAAQRSVDLFSMR